MLKTFLILILSFFSLYSPIFAQIPNDAKNLLEFIPYGYGVLSFEPHEQKTFSFYQGTISVTNEREELLLLFTFIDEGVPCCAIIKGHNCWGQHYALPIPCQGEDIIVIFDYSWD
jgi:hypothetical protein